VDALSAQKWKKGRRGKSAGKTQEEKRKGGTFQKPRMKKKNHETRSKPNGTHKELGMGKKDRRVTGRLQIARLSGANNSRKNSSLPASRKNRERSSNPRKKGNGLKKRGDVHRQDNSTGGSRVSWGGIKCTRLLIKTLIRKRFLCNKVNQKKPNRKESQNHKRRKKDRKKGQVVLSRGLKKCEREQSGKTKKKGRNIGQAEI